MQTIANAFNLFINTDRNISSGGTGDAVSLPLGQTPIVAGDDEHIRLTLDQFSMRKSWHDINLNNNRVLLTRPGVGSMELQLAVGDYDFDISLFQSVVAEQLGAALNSLYGEGTFTKIDLDPEKAGAMELTQLLLFQFNAPTITDDNAPYIQCYTGMGDSYKVLGGKRIVGTPTVLPNPHPLQPVVEPVTNAFQSLKISITADGVFNVGGFYKCDLTPETHVYLAIDNQVSHNIATASHTVGDTPDPLADKPEMQSSRILAAIPIDTHYARYVSGVDRQYFMDLASRVASDLRVVLVDSVGRRFPFVDFNQGTLGDRSFKAVIRVDVIKGNKTGTLKSKPTPKAVPPRFSSTPAPVLNLGIPGYGLNVPGQVYGDGYVALSK